MNKENIKYRLLNKGVINLREFGYPSVNCDNILTDYVYASFFKSMLEENLVKSSGEIKEAIEELLTEIKVEEN